MSIESVLNNKNVQDLAESLDLDVPKEFLEVTDYYYVDTAIIIEGMNVVDKDGKFKRKVNLNKVLTHLKNMHVKFL